MTTSTNSKRQASRLAALGAGTFALLCASLASAQPQPPTPPAPPEPPAGPVPAAPDDPLGSCPPGAVCEATTVEPQGPEPKPDVATDPTDGTTVTLPPADPGADPNAPRWILVQPGGPGGQVIVYEPGNAPPHLPGGLVRPVPPPPPEPPPAEWEHERVWGIGLRAEGIILPRNSEDGKSPGMAGLGLSLRYRPIPFVALDASVDFVGGVDRNGYDRQEIPFGVSGIFYCNPDDLAQFYLLGGVDWSVARVRSDAVQAHLAEGTSDEYGYFGGHGGLGLEFRVTPLIGVDIDAVAFARVRTDDDGDGLYPEYVDWATGRTTNSSAGGLLRAGVTFWW
ncbi:MAG: hypothetical protein IT373_25600 [Polyangiaceae bacterium]|nr:hypothetical protein [Polyangiaceae bacterium]